MVRRPRAFSNSTPSAGGSRARINTAPKMKSGSLTRRFAKEPNENARGARHEFSKDVHLRLNEIELISRHQNSSRLNETQKKKLVADILEFITRHGVHGIIDPKTNKSLLKRKGEGYELR